MTWRPSLSVPSSESSVILNSVPDRQRRTALVRTQSHGNGDFGAQCGAADNDHAQAGRAEDVVDLA
jgi:hypothetical protein